MSDGVVGRDLTSINILMERVQILQRLVMKHGERSLKNVNTERKDDAQKLQNRFNDPSIKTASEVYSQKLLYHFFKTNAQNYHFLKTKNAAIIINTNPTI